MSDELKKEQRSLILVDEWLTKDPSIKDIIWKVAHELISTKVTPETFVQSFRNIFDSNDADILSFILQDESLGIELIKSVQFKNELFLKSYVYSFSSEFRKSLLYYQNPLFLDQADFNVDTEFLTLTRVDGKKFKIFIDSGTLIFLANIMIDGITKKLDKGVFDTSDNVIISLIDLMKDTNSLVSSLVAKNQVQEEDINGEV